MCLKKERKSFITFTFTLLLLPFKLLVFCLAVIAQGHLCLCPLLTFSGDADVVLHHTKRCWNEWKWISRKIWVFCFPVNQRTITAEHIKCWRCGLLRLTCFVCSLRACEVRNLQSIATPEDTLTDTTGLTMAGFIMGLLYWTAVDQIVHASTVNLHYSLKKKKSYTLQQPELHRAVWLYLAQLQLKWFLHILRESIYFLHLFQEALCLVAMALL